MSKAWKRRLIVILSSKNKQLILGDETTDNLDIQVRGTKYPSGIKDEFTVRVSNLTYFEIINIIKGGYTNVEIKCGYKNTNINTIFKGRLLYISNKLNNIKTNNVYMICTSALLANTKLLNLSFNSGINMYSALKYVCKMAGIKDSKISEEFKNDIIKESKSYSGNTNSILQQIISETNTGVISGDSSNGSIVNIFKINSDSSRVINVKKNSQLIVFQNGYPTISDEGLSCSVFPLINYCVGDILYFDNSLIDLGVTTRSQMNQFNQMYIDRNGKYIIYQITYTLENRGNEFSCGILAKSLTNSRYIGR